MDTFFRDLRYAARSLRRTPAFTVAALLCVALGVGANSALFSVIDAVLLRPLPYGEPERLVMVWEQKDRPDNVVSPGNYRDWVAQAGAFSDMAAMFTRHVNLTGLGEPEELDAQLVTANFFRTLGVAPALGRTFTAAEDTPSGPPVAILSDGFWRRHFAGDRGVLEKTITVNGSLLSVVGVMPPGFAFGGSQPDIWAPLRMDPARDYRATSGRYMQVVARLKPGVTAERAQSEMTTIARRLADAYPIFDAGWSANVVPLQEQVVGGARRALVILFGVVGFVLLISCANVAILQLARAAAREREMAVRAALGAARGRVVRQLLTESALLALAGGLVGLLLAFWAVRALVAAAPSAIPRVNEIALDARVVAFTLLVSLATGVLFGVVPALQASRADLQDALKASSRGTTRGGRARGALAATQVALSLVLLVGAGLLIKSMMRLSHVDPGFDPEGVLTMRIALPGRKYNTPEKYRQFFTELLARANALPGVRSASVTSWVPLGGQGSATDYWVKGRPMAKPGSELVADVRVVDPSFFRTMRIPVVRGQPFTAQDVAGGPVKVAISQELARTVFPGQDPLGQRLMMPWGDTLDAEIGAIVGDVKHAGLDTVPQPTTYWPLAQFPTSLWMTVLARGSGDPARLAAPMRAAVHALDADQPVADVKPLADYLRESVARRRFSATFLGAFAGMALLLSAIGLYGVISFSVAQRTRELGVRVALGAQAGGVLRLVVGEGVRVALVGVGAGVVGALLVTRVLGGLLYDVSATDPATFLVTAGVLTAVAMLAAYVPARRAARVDPIHALRAE